MQKLVTFGIAVYNVEPFISECIQSIISQPGDDIEILIVDDGSTDESGKICDKYAKEDSRIKVIHKENGGVSSARNAIIKNASGKWITFVDGDDSMDKNSAKTLRKFADDRYEIINFDVVYYRYAHSIPSYKNDIEPNTISGEAIYDLAISTVYCTGAERRKYVNRTVYSIWGKIYKTDFLRNNNIFFDVDLIKAQDMEFNFRCLVYTKNVKLVRSAFYQYRNNANSITKRYSKDIIKYNECLLDKYKSDISLYDESLKEKMYERYYCLHIVALKTDFSLNIFHNNNPKTKSERMEMFRDMLSGSYLDAVQNCNKDDLTKDDKKFYDYLIQNDFNKISKYFRKKDRLEKIKILAGQTGLIKIYKFILRKN